MGGGLKAAFAVLKWLQIETEIEEELIMEALSSASVRNYLPKVDVVELLEAKLGYTFQVKGLLIEALTHPSQQESGATYCYQVWLIFILNLASLRLFILFLSFSNRRRFTFSAWSSLVMQSWIF